MPFIIADAGIPMLFFHLPAMVLALLPVVAVEWVVAYRQFGIPKKKALKGVVAANCGSALLGFPLFWLIGVLVMVVAGPHLDRALPSTLSTLGQAFQFGVGMIWLGPEASKMDVTVAGLAMLVPAFFVSVYSERWLLRSAWKDVPPRVLSRYTWAANLLSYPVLVAIWLIYIAWIL